MKKTLTGSEIVIECLKEQGVDTVFGYPGGAILNIYDALYQHQDEIQMCIRDRAKAGQIINHSYFFLVIMTHVNQSFLLINIFAQVDFFKSSAHYIKQQNTYNTLAD